MGRVIVFLIVISGALPPHSNAISEDGSNNANSHASVVLRDPFWPVGYKPTWMQDREEDTRQQVLAGKNGKSDWNAAMNQVVINGVSSRSGNEYVAVINNEVKRIGESVSLWHGGISYTWLVESITPPGSVKLRRVSAQ